MKYIFLIVFNQNVVFLFQVKLTFEDRQKLYHDVVNCRRALVDIGLVRKPQEENVGLFRSTLRR